jgi:hypothetical protein
MNGISHGPTTSRPFHLAAFTISSTYTAMSNTVSASSKVGSAAEESRIASQLSTLPIPIGAQSQQSPKSTTARNVSELHVQFVTPPPSLSASPSQSEADEPSTAGKGQGRHDGDRSAHTSPPPRPSARHPKIRGSYSSITPTEDFDALSQDNIYKAHQRPPSPPIPSGQILKDSDEESDDFETGPGTAHHYTQSDRSQTAPESSTRRERVNNVKAGLLRKWSQSD